MPDPSGWVQRRTGFGRGLQPGRRADRTYAGGFGWATLGRVAELKTEQIIALLVPIVLIQVGLMIAALIDLERDERHVRGGSKLVWVIVIVFLNIVGPIVYFTVGREDA